MFCNQCGKKIPDDSKFCETCGAKVAAVSSQSQKETKEEKPNYILGYRFKENDQLNLNFLRESIEKKGDYRVVKADLVKKDIFVYQKGSSKFSPVTIFVKKRGEVFIIGNEKGLSSVRSRYLNEKFDKLSKDKISFSEISSDAVALITEFEFPIGEQKEKLAGVGGWLAYFIFGLFLSAGITIISSFAEFEVYSLIDIGIAVYALYVGYLLATIKPNAVKNAKIISGVYIAVNLLVIVLDPESISTEEGIFNPARGLFVSIIWLLYFYNSKRVKATYTS